MADEKPKPKGKARKIEVEKNFPSDETIAAAIALALSVSPVLAAVLSRRKMAAKQIRAGITKLMMEVDKRLRAITSRMVKREITIPQWQKAAADIIKHSHVAAMAIGKGGETGGLSGAGKITETQFNYFYNFARAVEDRRLSEKQIIARGGSYAKAVRSTYFLSEKDVAKDSGFTEVRRELNAMESCAGCLVYASFGFLPIDEMPGIGELECQNFCRCELIYR